MTTWTEDRLSTPLKFGWGVGSLGTVTVLNVQSILLLFFMTAVLGISPIIAGTLLFVSKIVDAVVGPLIGARSDRTHSAMGRRRPFLLAGALVSALAVAAIFNPPVSATLLLPWITACLVVLSTGYSLFNVPYIAMPAEMTSSPQERTSIMSWRIGFVAFGGLATAFAPLLAKSAGGGRTGYGLMGLVLAAIIAFAMLIAFRASKTARGNPPSDAQGGAFKRFGVVFHNRPFLLLIAAKVLQLVGLASISASVLFLVKYVIHGDESLIAAYGVSSGVASIASMPLWVKLGRFWDKRTIFILACLGFALVTLTWTFAGPGDGAVSLILRGAGAGIFSGGLLLMGQSILPDTIDFDCRRSGERREGIYAGAYSFVEKASSALGPLLVGAILQSFGFVAKAGNVQSAQAVTGIIIGASILPAAMYALSIVPLLRYDLKTHPGPSHSGPAQQAAA